jgi:predicted CoA-binding protein
MNMNEKLKTAETILVIDWPSKEVPELLALAGFKVVVRGGPGPEDYSAYELNNGKVVARRIGPPPERVDLVYSYRPLSELPEIISTAKSLQAKTIWTQSGMSANGVKDPKGCWLASDELQSARALVESAGLNYVSEPYIGDAAREVQV